MNVRHGIVVGVSLAILGLPGVAVAAPGGAPGNPFITPLVDSLAGVDVGTRFSVFGSGGQSVGAGTLTGPRLTLSRRTLLTGFGAYINNCAVIISGVPMCPDREPFIVQIHPAVGGVPDALTVLGSFTLTDDGDPLLVSFEQATMHLMLEPGTYFALVATGRPEDAGFVMQGAQVPFTYEADALTIGVISESGDYVVAGIPSAVRVLGLPIPPPRP